MRNFPPEGREPTDDELLAFYDDLAREDDPDDSGGLVAPMDRPSPEALRQAFMDCWPGPAADLLAAEEKTMAESVTGSRENHLFAAPRGRRRQMDWHHDFKHLCGIPHKH
jgi:hypothetical protein